MEKSVIIDSAKRIKKILNYGNIPPTANADILRLADPHIDSFNYFLQDGLYEAVRTLPAVAFTLDNGDRISLNFHDVVIGKPKLSETLGNSVNSNLYPKECIENSGTYSAPIEANLIWTVNGRIESPISCSLGEIPIMVKSKNCNLHGLSPAEMVRHGELVNETGGYFIVNGSCRLLRLLIANRRNYPIAMIRPSWKMRDTNFSDKGVLMRCVASDESSVINILHHLATGGVKLEFQLGNRIFLLPLMLVMKVLLNYSDFLIYTYLMRGRDDDMYFSEKVKMMLRELQEKRLFNQQQCKDYVGKTFRAVLVNHIAPWATNVEACDYLIENCILIHLSSPKVKFETMCMMTRKLFAFIGGQCQPETVDVVSMQEVSLGGHTYLQLLKQKLYDALINIKIKLTFKIRESGSSYKLKEVDLRNATRASTVRIGDPLKSFLATGTLPKNIKCGLMQSTGLSIILEHLNRMRDLSHLRAIHRGAYFVDMKTIGPRRLTGEAWGFICPVHTPDGAPCGLLNHLAYDCVVACQYPDLSGLQEILVALGMTPVDIDPLEPHNKCLEVVQDGALVGYVPKAEARSFVNNLRQLKIDDVVYKYTEIVLVEESPNGLAGEYPAIYVITSVSRMMRPVLHLGLNKVEYIGSFEQIHMNVAITVDDIEEGVHTHMELEKTSMLSNIAKLVPFSDCNPNPRNMYQCQMGKQTMGTPVHNWRSQTSTKLYRLNYPQIPITHNAHYDRIEMDEFCMGFNAILAVVSYTSYDMEDAMIINKSAMERGLAQGLLYKSEFVDLLNQNSARGKARYSVNQIFLRDPSKKELSKFLDGNGLPHPGTKLTTGDPYYCVYDMDQSTYKVEHYKGEDCTVDKYSVINVSLPKQTLGIQKVNITIRVRRDPIIGDKFASRSGQKGIMSRLFPVEDLPFSERGIVPDIIFNPHGIPSRMTAGTLIDLVAGKCGAEFGNFFDSTPFEFNDDNPAYDYFGQILEKAGFNYFGEDVLYSGVDGRMMEVEIFEGVVYYQRLRHMTADKWQVRSTGPVDTVTHQPIKGRKRGGAIRFGEMERDCLIAHGASYTLKDRLLDCSDDVKEWVCTKCGSVLSTLYVAGQKQVLKKSTCSVCGPETDVRLIHIPYAFKYLVAELASFNVKVQLGVQSAEQITRTIKVPEIVPS